MFTSRLPKSTSVRRPSNPNDGFTSLIGSNIPISVKKANLFTPQPKRSLQNGINSTSRKSFMTTDKKYQRTSKPAPDRDEQIRMFETLVDFLKTYAPNFPIPEAKRFFSSVSTTECTRIFEFLISRINPDFKINKLEIDVPEALASLDYPYIRSVTKSALVSITTRQAIVNLLVIFDWLVNFVKISTELDLAAPIESTADDEREQIIFSCLMTNPMDPRGEVERMMDKFASNSKPAGDIEKINADIDRIADEVEEIEELHLEKQSIIEDLEKCAKYEEDMKQYIRTKQDEEAALQQRIVALDMEISKMSREHEIILPSVDSEMDDDLACDPTSIARLTEEIRLIEQEIEVEKQDRRSVEVHETNRKQKDDLDRLNVRYASLDKELASRETKEFDRLQALRAEAPRAIELRDKYLKECLESNKMEAVSLVRKAEANMRSAEEVAKLVKEDNKLLRVVALKVKREV